MKKPSFSVLICIPVLMLCSCGHGAETPSPGRIKADELVDELLKEMDARRRQQCRCTDRQQCIHRIARRWKAQTDENMRPARVYFQHNLFNFLTLLALIACLVVLWPGPDANGNLVLPLLLMLTIAFNAHKLWRSHVEIKAAFALLAKAPGEAPAPEGRDYFYGLHTNIRSSAGRVDLYDGNILMHSIRRAMCIHKRTSSK
jgi:hypothetical protein